MPRPPPHMPSPPEGSPPAGRPTSTSPPDPTPDPTLNPTPSRAPPSPAGPLDQLSRDSGLSIDDQGRFLHRGEPITHARTLEVLWGSLQAGPDGRWQVQIGRERADVAVDETPWTVRAMRPEGDPPRALTLLLCGGREARLDASTLFAGPDGVLRCRLGDGAMARFTRAGQAALGELLEEDTAGGDAGVLCLAGVRHRIASPGKG